MPLKSQFLSVYSLYMKRKLTPRAITNPIINLLMPSKGKNMHKLYPEEYYQKVWFNKQMFDGIELVSKI